MKTNDVTEIIKFASIVSVYQQFTSNKDLLRNADTTYPSGLGNYSALYASIYKATNDLKLQPPNLVRSVIAFTDGGESNSAPITRSQMISNALSGGIPVYALFLYSDTLNKYYRDMKNIADTTGGFVFWVNLDSCLYLDQIYYKISRQLVSSYDITIDWQGILPAAGTVVNAIITTTYLGSTSSFTRSYIMP